MKLAPDKVQHFAGGVVLGVLGYFVSAAIGYDPVLGAVGLAASIGFAKEAVDALDGKGTVEFLDFAATAGGGVLAALVLVLLLGDGAAAGAGG